MNPQEPPVPTAKLDALFTKIGTTLNAHRQTYHYALEIGLRPTEILAYARGELVGEERDIVQSLISESPWALSRVVAIVKMRRTKDVRLVDPDDAESGMKFLDSL